MKNLISTILLLITLSNIAIADCDFSTGITPGPNKTFIYTEACHQKVGKLVQDNATQAQQIVDYQKAIQLKDLALTTADQRTQMWTTTAENEQDRMTKISQDQSRAGWLAFGLGVLTTIGAGFMTARLIK